MSENNFNTPPEAFPWETPKTKPSIAPPQLNQDADGRNGYLLPDRIYGDEDYDRVITPSAILTRPKEQRITAGTENDNFFLKDVGQQEVTIDDLLSYVVDNGCSDLHIAVGVPPVVRLNEKLLAIPGTPVMTQKITENMVKGIMTSEQQKKYEQNLEADFSYTFLNKARFRVNAFHQKGNCSMALRSIPTKAMSLEELKLPPIIGKFSELSKGLVLVTGPTGSGKTTTLAAIIDRINHTLNKHIITIEDPIEFQHDHKKSIVQQREIGEDTLDFGKALRSILREDPDVVLIGEMRDLETIAAAITTAETGHLVFGTLHTNSAASSIDRMIDVFPPHQQQQIRAQLSSSLAAIISQRLIPNLRGGRTCVMEIMICTSAIRNLIRENKSHQLESMMTAGKDNGMQLFDITLAAEVRKGVIAYDVALGYCNDPKQFAESCGKR